jgi:hypothetical protein
MASSVTSPPHGMHILIIGAGTWSEEGMHLPSIRNWHLRSVT